MKGRTRFFRIHCCDDFLEIDEKHFAASGKLDLHCDRHDSTIVNYLTWQGGVSAEEAKKAKMKEETHEATGPKPTTR